jgi:hypothetical protein
MLKNKDLASVPKLEALTVALHDLFKRETADVVEIGRLLRAAKKEVGHGKFLPWLEREFSLSERTAQNYISAHTFMIDVAAPLLKSEKFSDLRLRPSALYMLADMYQRKLFSDNEKLTTYSVTVTDIEAVLRAAKQGPVGGKRIAEIMRERHAPELTKVGEADGVDIAPTDAPIVPEQTEAPDGKDGPPTEAASDVRDGRGDQSAETPPEPAPKPKSAPSAKDHGNLLGFTANILNLKRLATGSAKKYVGTAVQTADLETVAEFVRAVAELKRRQRIETSTSAEATAEAREAQYAGVEAA